MQSRYQELHRTRGTVRSLAEIMTTKMSQREVLDALLNRTFGLWLLSFTAFCVSGEGDFSLRPGDPPNCEQ